ncbi:MAG: MFS transporter [Theionarchaea archaeon]|nr:MFS transporter [Theionarchaea archaeon]
MNRQVGLVCFITLMRDIGTFIVAPFVILYLRSLDISIVSIGMLYGLLGALDIIFSLPFGHLSDKWGRKPWMISSSVFAVFTYGLFVVSRSVPQFVVVFVLWNLSDLAWQYSVPMYLHDIVENTGRGDALAKVSMMTTIAGVIAPAPAGLLADIYGIDLLFKVAILYEIVIIGTVLYWMQSGLKELKNAQNGKEPEEEKSFNFKGLIFQLRGNIFYFTLAMMIMSFGWAVLEIVTPLFLREELGISYLGFGAVMSAIGIVGAVAKLGAGKFTDIHGRRPTLLISTLCAGVCMVAIGFVATELQFLLTRGTGSIFGAVMWIVWMASFHDIIKKKRATISAFIDTLSGITYATGSFMTGIAVGVITARRCFFLIGAIYILTMLIFLKTRSGVEETALI